MTGRDVTPCHRTGQHTTTHHAANLTDRIRLTLLPDLGLVLRKRTPLNLGDLILRADRDLDREARALGALMVDEPDEYRGTVAAPTSDRAESLADL